MAGSLVKIDEETVTSAVASVDLGGSSWNSSYDVYLVRLNNVNTSADCSVIFRFLVSSSPDTSANYDKAQKNFRGDGAFSDSSITNQTSINVGSIGTGTQEQSNGIIYIFNANDSSEYSFMTCEMSTRNNDSHLRGFQGGGLLTVAQATNGVSIINDSGNFTSGTFVLYGFKK